jgi:hypothetical protein
MRARSWFLASLLLWGGFNVGCAGSAAAPPVRTAPAVPSIPTLPGMQPVHPAPAALEQAVLDATRAYLREDAVGARAALDRLEEACRKLQPEEAGEGPQDLVTYDRAFHAALGSAREHAGAGEVASSFDQFAWVQRGCRVCHGIARDMAAGKISRRPAE